MATFNVTPGSDNVNPGFGFLSSDPGNQTILIDGALITEPNPIPESLLAGNDEIFGLAGNDFINAGNGNDLIDGDLGNDFLVGGDGEDSLDGGADFGLPFNTLDGGDGFDFVTYENDFGVGFPSTVTVDLSVFPGTGTAFGRTDTLFSIEGVIGSTFSANVLTGNSDSNTLMGGDNNDTIDGGGGSDVLEGGLGDDTYTISLTSSGGTQIEDAGGASDTLVINPALTLVPAAPMAGTIGMGRSGESLLIDISQDGIINPADDLTILNFYANATDDIAGTGLIENLVNLNGNNILNLIDITPSVSVTTPTANNTTPGSPVPDITPFSNLDLPGGEQLYLFSNEPDFEPVPAAAAGRQVLALSGNDNVTGTSNADDVVGNKGADTLSGGAENDTLRGGQGSDVINGQENNSFNPQREILNGNQDNDTLNGGLGDDIIRGGKGEDVLLGNEGNDVLIGDRDQDILTGNAGSDTFVLVGGDAAANSLDEADLITDFVAADGDKIMLTDALGFGDLSLTQVELQVDGGASVMSIAIQAPDSSYLGIVQGALSLVAGNFVPEDTNITMLG
jgi:Ca2+-binding RTX toxin-like protein